MIGHSGSGKTTYMGGLYKLYGDDPNGFGLSLNDSSKRTHLQELGKKIMSGRYPSGTDIAEEYKFWLQYDNTRLIPFNWYDYRGGALLESSKYSREAELLIQKIEKSDALIVFLDGAKIVNMSDDDLEEEYETSVWCIQKALSKRASDEHYFPISFVITKGDLYEKYDVLYNSPGVEYFLPVIKNIAESKVAAGMLGVVEASSSGIFNVSAPLMFSLYYGMHHYIAERVKNFEAELERFNRLDPGIFDDIFSTIIGVKSDREMACECFARMQNEKEHWEMLEGLGEVLGKSLENLTNDNRIIRF